MSPVWTWPLKKNCAVPHWRRFGAILRNIFFPFRSNAQIWCVQNGAKLLVWSTDEVSGGFRYDSCVMHKRDLNTFWLWQFSIDAYLIAWANVMKAAESSSLPRNANHMCRDFKKEIIQHVRETRRINNNNNEKRDNCMTRQHINLISWFIQRRDRNMK